MSKKIFKNHLYSYSMNLFWFYGQNVGSGYALLEMRQQFSVKTGFNQHIQCINLFLFILAAIKGQSYSK